MIERQLRPRGIRDERVLEAMFEVPRHEFVPMASIEAAYEDRPLPIGESETISQPNIVTAAAPRVPEVLKDQLAEGGRMVIPVGDLRHQDLLLIARRGNQFTTRALDPCQFVPLIGTHGWPEKEGWVQ